MSAFNPRSDRAALRARLDAAPSLIVACYCAAWCDTCTQYRQDFDTLATDRPEYTFVWIDIEDSPEFLGDEDVENFPTVAIQTAESTLFFGAMPRHVQHLERLIAHADESGTMAGGPPLVMPMVMSAAQ